MEKEILDKIWNQTLEKINLEESEMNAFENIIENTKLVKLDDEDNVAIILCENIFSKTILNNKWKHSINEALQLVTNSKFSSQFLLKSELSKRKSEKKKNENQNDTKLLFDDWSIQRQFTFESFYVTEKNTMPYKACLSVSLNPSNGPWNPLFLYGGSGLGKTHLLHAIGNGIINNFPTLNVKYLSIDEFGREVVEALSQKNNRIEKIKNFYNSFDVLLIDDIQIIASRTRTKDVLFQIIVHFMNNKKQIVITSDVKPKDLGDFENRFITRFENGLSYPIYAPDYKTARQILIGKLETMKEVEVNNFEDEALDYIAYNFSSNVRELEGALNRIIFWMIQNDLDKISLETAKLIFQGFEKTGKKISIEKIKKEVCKHYGITIKEIDSNLKIEKIATPRAMGMYLSRELTNETAQKIGLNFGKKNHSTVTNACKKIRKLKEDNSDLNDSINELIRKIKS